MAGKLSPGRNWCHLVDDVHIVAHLHWLQLLPWQTFETAGLVYYGIVSFPMNVGSCRAIMMSALFHPVQNGYR